MTEAPITPLSEKRVVMRNRVIRAAATQMNEQGATSINLGRVAKSIGLTRNALYYYFKNGHDLVYACYLEAAQAFSTDLDFVLAENSCVLDKLRKFVELTLLGANAERAVLSDISSLPEQQRRDIFELNQRNFMTLTSMIKEGIDKRELRDVNPEIAAKLLQSLLSWSQLWYLWVPLDEQDMAQRYEISVKAIENVFLNGVSSNKEVAFECPFQFKSIFSREVDMFDSASVQKEKYFQIVGTASWLFNCRGIDAISLEDVATHLGTTKGTVYRYFSDKPSLITACIEQALDQFERIIQFSEKSSDCSLEVYLTVTHLNCQAQASKWPPLFFQVFNSDYASRVNQNLSMRIHDIRLNAVKQGSLNHTEKHSFNIVAGIFQWITSWHHSQTAFTNIELADQICKIVSRGIVCSK